MVASRATLGGPTQGPGANVSKGVAVLTVVNRSTVTTIPLYVRGVSGAYHVGYELRGIFMGESRCCQLRGPSWLTDVKGKSTPTNELWLADPCDLIHMGELRRWPDMFMAGC